VSHGTPIRQSYLICATPRSGSNWLCEVLRSTGNLGHPDDYFWNRPIWYRRWGVTDFPSYFHRLLHEGTTSNHVFGSKMMWDYLAELVPHLAALLGLTDACPADVLAAAFPDLHHVWLTRHDKVRQGISYYRALETKIWRSTDVATVPPLDPSFSFGAIDSLVRLVTCEDQAWQDYFQRHGITPLAVAYEDLSQAPEVVAQRILRYLGLPPPAQLPFGSWQHQRQADALSDEWVERYNALKPQAI
jgi:trehalose 2-sulfotransferase